MLLLCAAPLLARADAPQERFNAGGYFRIMARPELEGGQGRLGFYNLYGRLLNEGPYGMLDLRLNAVPPNPATNSVWASVHTRIEGSSFSNADPGGGNLGNFRASQLFIRAGNVLFEDVVWQLGTLENFVGDLGLYDLRPANLFYDSLGLSANYQKPNYDILIGLGDAGFFTRGAQYSTVLTAGAMARYRVIPGKLEIGVGAQYLYEPQVVGSRFAPYQTPGIDYEAFLRREVVERFLEENPGQQDQFPNPEPRSNQSYRLVGFLGFGGFGPIVWNNLFVNRTLRHPDNFYSENFGGRETSIFVSDFTDERYVTVFGNEMTLRLIPNVLDAVWSVLYQYENDLDNQLSANELNRESYSTVVRMQAYFTEVVHLLFETSLARERSLNGNLYRSAADSVFRSEDGASDPRGLEFGDSDTRNTMQFKIGPVFNPAGRGVWNRPSLRLLYGLQYSSQQAAYPNAFVESLDQFNVFTTPERHWHSVVSLEAEGWF